jgi:hypothetical protein
MTTIIDIRLLKCINCYKHQMFSKRYDAVDDWAYRYFNALGEYTEERTNWPEWNPLDIYCSDECFKEYHNS